MGDGTGISSALRKGRVFEHFGFTENMALVSYVPKKKWILISTEIYGNETVGSERNYKADIVLRYNGAKGALTTGDQMAGEYSCIRRTKIWPLDFSWRWCTQLLSMPMPSGQKKSYFSNIRNERKLFLRALTMELAKPNVLARKNSNSGHHRYLSTPTDLFLGQMSEITSPFESSRPRTNKSDGCSFCPRKKAGKTRYFCSFCQRFICKLHRQDEKRFYV
jgi:hypothetical protein